MSAQGEVWPGEMLESCPLSFPACLATTQYSLLPIPKLCFLPLALACSYWLRLLKGRADRVTLLNIDLAFYGGQDQIQRSSFLDWHSWPQTMLALAWMAFVWCLLWDLCVWIRVCSFINVTALPTCQLMCWAAAGANMEVDRNLWATQEWRAMETLSLCLTSSGMFQG